MAFNLYFAGQQAKEVDKHLQEKNCLRLFSQANERAGIADWQTGGYAKNLFIDSGAVSVAHSGKIVDIDTYISYINSNPNIPIFVELDVIPFPILNAQTAKDCCDASWDNYLYMRTKVKSPDKLLPIFHRRENWYYLEQMLETTFDGRHIPYIGIAATTDSSTAEKEEWFHKVFQVIQKSSNPNVKTHAFGMTSLRLLESFPFTSADSTSWIMTAINGGIMSPYGVIIVSERQKHLKNNIYNQAKPVKEAFLQYIETLDLTLQELQTEPTARLIANIKYLVKWCENYKYKPITIQKRSLF